jgi:hypothetical protein
MNLRKTQNSNKLPVRLLMTLALCILGFFYNQTADAVSVNTNSYDPSSGVSMQTDKDSLVLGWDTPEGSTELSLNISGKGSLVRSIAVASATSKPVVVLRDADPITVLSIGQRDLKKRGGWNIFFDPTNRKLSKSGQLTLKLKSVVVRSVGNRCIVDLGELEGSAFSGKLRFTLYAGCDLIHLQSIVQTKKDARALLYHAGLTCDPKGKSVSWIGLDDKLHRADEVAQPAKPVKVRHRTIALETEEGALAVFPPPHRYFYPLDEAYNLGFTWQGNDFMNKVSGFGIGIRQDLKGDDRWVPWFNAPPGTQQELGIFWLPSLDRGNKLFDRVKAYTHKDRFPVVQGHKTFTSHYHIEHTTNFINARKKSGKQAMPPSIKKPDFVDVFKNSGIEIVHLAEFHNRLGPSRRDPVKSLPLLKAMHDECARLSDDDFLLLPGEEPNVHLGGHWISFFPRPVMWVLKRSKGKPFIEEHPDFGRIYHLGSPEDVLKLMELEKGLMWAAHPRIKSSTGYPDRYRNERFFKSDRYLGGAWKAMPADLSRPRLGWRVLDLLDDTSNWGAKKYIVGEVDIFEVDRTTEFYAHANINYLRLDHIPRFEDGWDPVLKALRDGAFFISTGEVLMPRFTIEGKQSGQTLKLQDSGMAKLEVVLTWTFPMSFIEIVTGDGKKVYRDRIELTDSEAFGKETFKRTLNLKGKSWVRLEAWDIATNGVISQPIWLE